MITFTAIVTEVLFIVFPGLVLHRAVAVYVLTLDKPAASAGEIRETDLLVYGLLPGLAIANTVGTVLAIFGLFRTTVFVAVMTALVIWRWRDALATLFALRDLGSSALRSLGRGELMTLVAIVIFAETAFALVVQAQLPSQNIDVWNHNLPLGQSIVGHGGFVMPQLPNLFYGTYPIFFHMFFAQGLLFVDHVLAAKMINTIIYLSFLLSLLFCAKRARALMAVVLAMFVINVVAISSGASDAMTDVPRICYSALAVAFAFRYLHDGRLYFLFAAGILGGGAVAGKYTELLTPVFLGLALLPCLVRRPKEGWIATAVLAAGFLPIACYPYLRNWILLDNPIYPFFFAHPGLTNEYMAQINLMLGQDPTARGYDRNLFSVEGWSDFLRAGNDLYGQRWEYAKPMYAVIALGLVLYRSYVIYLALCTLILGLFWYTVGAVNMRWGLGVALMFETSAFLSAAWIVDRAIATFEPAGKDWCSLLRVGSKWPWLGSMPAWLSPNNLVRLATLGGLGLYLCWTTIERAREEGWTEFVPYWTTKATAKAMFGPEGMDAFLSKNYRGYQIYRFIGEHDLKMVFQPFDNGAWAYQSAYNGGRNGDWMILWTELPKGSDDLDAFVRRKNVRYFVYRTLEPGEMEYFGSNHVKRAYALFEYLLPKSRRLLVDPFGWELYAIDGAAAP
jgi:hypothetical protein